MIITDPKLCSWKFQKNWCINCQKLQNTKGRIHIATQCCLHVCVLNSRVLQTYHTCTFSNGILILNFSICFLYTFTHIFSWDSSKLRQAFSRTNSNWRLGFAWCHQKVMSLSFLSLISRKRDTNVGLTSPLTHKQTICVDNVSHSEVTN